MGILDVLFGRTKLPKSKAEDLFALSTAEVTLTTRLNLVPAGKAGICFRPTTSSHFEQAEQELRKLVDISTRATQTRYEVTTDSFGFRWIVLRDEQFEDLVANVHIVGRSLEDEGFGEQLLAAVFKFLEGERAVYWIYNYKRGKFYPFVPTGEQQRDNTSELRLQALMTGELPMEAKLEQWYALWGIPL